MLTFDVLYFIISATTNHIFVNMSISPYGGDLLQQELMYAANTNG